MPHCILETSQNFKPKTPYAAFFSELHSTMVRTGMFKLEDIKSRVRVAQDELIADGVTFTGFVYLQISILEGRPREGLKELSGQVMKLMQDLLVPEGAAKEISIAVEIREMDREFYLKAPVDPG